MSQDLATLRHSTAHIMAAAVKNIFPNTKLGIGPTIEDGFYYDFDSSHRFSKEDFKKIEAEMQNLKKRKIPFERVEKKIGEAEKIAVSLKETYKKELIKDLKEQGKNKVSFYKTGNFIDLCKGPHVGNSSEIGEFRLLSVAGAYWKGREKNKMLQRIYGTSWPTNSELSNYIKRLETAKERDHRKINKELDLFMTSEEVGQGLPIWLPDGTAIRLELERFVIDMERAHGYQHIHSPHLARLDLYKTSGHWQHYRDFMYPPIKIDNEHYLLRAMNCPHHIIVYKNKPRSYRDLPVKIAEVGTVYRYEKSGELSGLSRVRSFTINDAHIFCTKEQISNEIGSVLKLIDKLYKAVGFTEYRLDLALRDPKDKEKYVNGDKMWDETEKQLKKAIQNSNQKFEIKIGEAAFYGPKIDVQAKDALGREFTISTIQLDSYLPKRFCLEFTDSQGEKQTPFLIHRALIGSFERFFAFLIEHHAGRFPLWLSPTQVIVLPIAERHSEYSEKILKDLKKKNFRAEVNLDNETLQAKIRKAQLQKIPYMLVIGDKERVKKMVSVRPRDKKNIETMKLEDFTSKMKAEIVKERNDQFKEGV